MKTLEELKARQTKELADFQAKEVIASLLPLPAKQICIHSKYDIVVFGADYPNRYSFREALVIMDRFTPIPVEHRSDGCTSVAPREVNSTPEGKLVGESEIELKIAAGKGYDSHALVFWVRLGDRLTKVEVELRPEHQWIPETHFTYDTHGNCTHSRVSPACIGEDQKRKWWSPEGSYQISYYWKDLASFNATFRPIEAMQTLKDTPKLRAKRLAAYKAGQYRFNPPPVCHSNWSDEAWMNWVEFNDPKLTGFLPYTSHANQ